MSDLLYKMSDLLLETFLVLWYNTPSGENCIFFAIIIPRRKNNEKKLICKNVGSRVCGGYDAFGNSLLCGI